MASASLTQVLSVSCRQAVESSYAKATEEIEAHIPSRGRVLLSVDATNGDTMFFAPVKPDIAPRWRDKASSEQDVCRAGVCSSMDRFSVHTACAARGMSAAKDQSHPPGTRLRSDVIPFTEWVNWLRPSRTEPRRPCALSLSGPFRSARSSHPLRLGPRFASKFS
jgi:hypothetical protein